MTNIWMATVFAPVGIIALWLMVRCRLGFHGHTTRERIKGVLSWRCERCFRVIGETADVEPSTPQTFYVQRWPKLKVARRDGNRQGIAGR